MYDAPPEVEDWNIIQAARWAGVPAWELMQQPAGWLHKILLMMEVEAAASPKRKKKNAN